MTCTNCGHEFEDPIYIPSPGNGNPVQACPECERPVEELDQ